MAGAGAVGAVYSSWGGVGCCQVHWSDGSRRSGHFRGVLMVREREPGSIVIVGSLNADLTVQTARFPQPGETVSGGDLTVLPGGKGANQAVAAARLGGKVRMIGAVGGRQQRRPAAAVPDQGRG